MKLRSSTILLLLFALFLSAGLVTAYFAFRPDSPQSVAKKMASDLSAEVKRAQAEISRVLMSVDSPATLSGKLSYPCFIYRSDSLVYWSDHHYVPPVLQVADTFDLKLLKTGNESYLALKKQVDRDRYIVALIFLQRDYIINNDYLSPEWNVNIFPSGNVKIWEPSALTGISVCLEDRCFFKVVFLPGSDIPVHAKTKRTSSLLLGAAIVVLIALIYRAQNMLRRRYPAEVGLAMLYVSFLALRWLMTTLDFPYAFIHTPLFDPQVFASSNFNASLGDLFLNMVAVCALSYYVFRNFSRFYFLRFREYAVGSWVIRIFAALCVLFAGLFPVVVIQTLYNNSTLVLDISQSLSFKAQRIIAIITVMLSGVCSFLFAHAFIRIACHGKKIGETLLAFGIAALIFSMVNELTQQMYVASLTITAIYFLLVYFLGLYKSLARLTYGTFAYLFICTFCWSAIGAYTIQYFSHHKKIENQFRFANNFLIERDIFGEYLLHQASLKIANDAFTQTRITSPFLGKESISQKIRQFLLPSYFNKYDVEIFIFNAQGQSVEGEPGLTFSEMVSRYDADPYRTNYEGIYFVNNPESDITQKYLIKVPIERASVVTGYVVVELSLKKVIPDNVYPELLVDHRFQQFYHTQDLSYAIFINNKILFASGEYNYDKFFQHSWLGQTKLYTEGIQENSYDHIAQEDENGRIAVVSTRTVPFSYNLANFSFLFVLGLFVILLLIFIQGIYNYFRGSRLFFSGRIQLYLNLAFFVPLIVVSISTLSLTSRSSQQQLDNEYLSRSRVFGQQITTFLSDHENNYTSAAFNEHLNDLANLSTTDANIYSAQGLLLATSQPKIFDSHLLSPYINPVAFQKIRSGETTFISSERVGKLDYFVAYATLKSPKTAKLIGILGIPFFQSAYFLEKVQIVIFTNILNIFAFIFITLLVLSYFVSEWLTFPLRFITQSLRKTSLTKTNTPLSWNTNDEIGMMVKEYNSMLFKLGESKSELEHTQREKAWREIAQQVAHEIKNPLTPMKLTLQQLERAVQAGNGSVEKTRKAIEVLLSQVDTLNDIASSFSGFAKMPEPVMRRFELIDVVKRIVDLHSPSGSISFRTTIKEAWVMGDEQMLSRTFSNIILNGFQAGLPGQRVQLNVQVERKGNAIRIEFRDNGKGIDPAIADRVFLPHFSTKRSGSGLGLAIARQAIEQMNGKIWFETRPGLGTSFFIQLPFIDD